MVADCQATGAVFPRLIRGQANEENLVVLAIRHDDGEMRLSSPG